MYGPGSALCFIAYPQNQYFLKACASYSPVRLMYEQK